MEQNDGLRVECPECHSMHIKNFGPSISFLAAKAKEVLEYAYQCEMCGCYFKSNILK